MKKILRVFSLVLVLCTLLAVSAVPAHAATYGSRVEIVNYDAVSGGRISQHYATFTLKGAIVSKNVKIVSLYTTGKSGSAVTSKATFDVKVHDSNGRLIREYRNLKIGSTFSIPGGFRTSTVYVCSKFPGYDIHSNVHNAGAMLGRYTLR